RAGDRDDGAPPPASARPGFRGLRAARFVDSSRAMDESEMCMVDEADAQATCVDPTAPELEPPGGQPTMPYLPPANVDAQTARARAELQAGLYDGNEQPSPRIYKCTEANPYGLPPAPIPDVEWSGPYRGPKVVMPGTPG